MRRARSGPEEECWNLTWSVEHEIKEERGPYIAQGFRQEHILKAQASPLGARLFHEAVDPSSAAQIPVPALALSQTSET